MAKYKATFPIGAKSKASKSRKKKEQKKKREKKRIAASESRRTRTCIIFRSLGGEPIDDNYETEACGIPQLETSLSFCQGSRVEGSMSRVEGNIFFPIFFWGER